MLVSRNPVFAALLAMLLALALALPAGTAFATLPVDRSVCEGCCATSPGQARCDTVSVCASASAESGAEETSIKPLGAWAVGVLRAALPPAMPSTMWAAIPASGCAGPPSYLSFGRFLL